jgi:hypothetical protein
VATLSLKISESDGGGGGGGTQFASRTPTRAIAGRNMNGERSSVRRGAKKQGSSSRSRGRGRSEPVVQRIKLQ